MTDVPNEENPYWHSEGQPHFVDLESVRRLCFEIFNIFAASAALAGDFEFAEEIGEPEGSFILTVHRKLAESTALERLLQLSVLVRTYDDIVSKSELSERYAEHLQTISEDGIGVLEEGNLSVREVCNKVIHAREIRAVYDHVDREVEKDGKIESEKMWHLTGEIELKGTMNKKAWNATLFVQPFLEAVLDRITFGWD
jgi:hypothetical protein